MKKQIAPFVKAHLIRGTFYLLLLFSMGTIPFALSSWQPHAQRTLTFAQRVAYQRVIEEVYWRHRIWPKERPDAKPSLDAVMSQAELERKVADYLRKSQELEDYWQRPLGAEQLQAEMDRMAQHTKQPEVLRELFEALENDPLIIAECLARPMLAERLLTNFYANDQERFYSWQARAVSQMPKVVAVASDNYTLPAISDDPNSCTDDTWIPTSIMNAPAARFAHTAVWTGSEMIIWGGSDGVGYLSTGGRYIPGTDSWTATSAVNAPTAREYHTAVWTGSEMIVWGGGGGSYLDTGGRYNPSTDSWTATNTSGAPAARAFHTAVWTGSEMIIWGGTEVLNTGGRYNPSTDAWIATSTTGAPSGRQLHTAVWIGTEMIVWGGVVSFNTFLNTGGRYNPVTDSWVATSINNAPTGRDLHTAVCIGSEMIVWGGYFFDGDSHYLNTGGRYNPSTDTWTATSITNAPIGRESHTAVWTDNEMIVWGGLAGAPCFCYQNTGGRYDPSMDSWTATSTISAPDARYIHTAIWIGSQMIIWGGSGNSGSLNTGGRYCAQSSAPSPTATATVTPTASATPSSTATSTPTVTPTPTPTSTLRPTPTPRPRPTPAARP